MKIITYTQPDGTTAICRPVPWARLIKKYKTQEVSPPQPLDLYLGRGIYAADFNEADVEYAETEDEFLQRIINKDIPTSAVDVKTVDGTLIPVERTYRNSLKTDLTFDMVKAKEIHKQKLREIRKPLMEALDSEYFRADEAGDIAKKNLIASQKQVLRDITKRSDLINATTIEALKKVTL